MLKHLFFLCGLWHSLPLAITILILTNIQLRCHIKAESIDCSFNSMCTCVREENDLSQESLQNVNCMDVPFYKIPIIPESRITELEIVGAKISSLESDSLSSSVQALILSNNGIQYIFEKALSLSARSLTSLDLSYNKLDEVPFQALKDLRNVQWINLHGNQISSITGDWSDLKTTLSTLFLGENDITELSGDFQFLKSPPPTTLHQLKSLIWLNLDGNSIHKMHKHSLPPNLKTLSVSFNAIENFPLDVVLSMPHLQWLYLRGNNIKSIPEYTFSRKIYLEKIDLSENNIKHFPNKPFNRSIAIRDLNLASNDLKTISKNAFYGLQTKRIILTHNSLVSLERETFNGIEDVLEYLDLDHNYLKKLPEAVKTLRNLKYLYISGNDITSFPDEETFFNAQLTLRALSISSNKLVKIPINALKNTKRISYLNAAFNEIYEINSTDFKKWGSSLKTLVLNNNRISFIKDNTFSELTELKELSLSYNTFTFIEDNAFAGLENLETLELTFSLDRNELPYEILKHLKNLRVLLLDFNNFYEIHEQSFDTTTQLTDINLNSNKIQIIPKRLFKIDLQNLRNIRLSNNEIRIIESQTFNSLKSLNTVFLTNNKISSIEKEAFIDMDKLTHIALQYNMINSIDELAFKNLSSLKKLSLEYNNLKDISFKVFENVGNKLFLNLSHNEILHCNHKNDLLEIISLDLSYNNIDTIPKCLKDRKNLRKLYLNHNKIRSINYENFKDLPSLQKLTLNNNGILAIDSAGFYGLGALQILDLSKNRISYLHVAQFVDNPNLKVLNLHGNNLSYLPRDVFANTVLEMIDLSLNSLSSVPTTSLSDINLSLRHLSLAGNNIDHVDITSFPDFPFLQNLDLSQNKLTILPDNAFTSLNLLQNLDLSSNPIRANFKELFHYARNLKELNLADVGMVNTPQLPLLNLVKLNLSLNSFEVLNKNTFQNLEKLKTLDLSNCNLMYVPNHIWPNLPNLKELDISHNPIKEITSDSFHGLKSLKILNIHHLRRLQKFEGKSVAQLKILSKLYLLTLPSLEDFYQEFCYILTHLTQLKVLKIIFQEHELNHQLSCLANKKLTNLEIAGRNLRIIDSNAFSSLTTNPSLSIKIFGTLIHELPAGLFAHMKKIPYLAIDLSDNMLNVLNPDTFYGNSTSWDSIGASAIIGGLKLTGNRFRCGCHLAWLGHWLRRWARESLDPHTASIELSLRVQQMSQEATCWDFNLEKHVPIVKLPPVDISCQTSALSSGGKRVKGFVFVIFLSVFRFVKMQG